MDYKWHYNRLIETRKERIIDIEIKSVNGYKEGKIFYKNNNLPHSYLINKFVEWNGWKCKTYSPCQN